MRLTTVKLSLFLVLFKHCLWTMLARLACNCSLFTDTRFRNTLSNADRTDTVFIYSSIAFFKSYSNYFLLSRGRSGMF